MLDILLARLQQKYRTMKFPDGPPPDLPDRFLGRPVIVSNYCPVGCDQCLEVCPTQALYREKNLRLDLGRCLFCAECVSVCAPGNIRFTRDYRLAASRREDLLIEAHSKHVAASVHGLAGYLFRRSLKLRQVSAGGCNACEADINVLGTVGWDVGRFGIQFVASPRHADGLVITGPVPENMRVGLMKTYEAVPAPKLVIAVGSCAISGGPYAGHAEVHNGADSLLPVDLYIPGCPPHPLTILDGLLRFIGRIDGLQTESESNP
ncbi:MAG: NADH-quinone oxidoreductase subunit NuoB [Deltaproteobacteria bacterium]|nr:NADH-quinone oxidoreductase subunit NuoB [Deltaproteobacteria bacterium]